MSFVLIIFLLSFMRRIDNHMLKQFIHEDQTGSPDFLSTFQYSYML